MNTTNSLNLNISQGFNISGAVINNSSSYLVREAGTGDPDSTDNCTLTNVVWPTAAGAGILGILIGWWCRKKCSSVDHNHNYHVLQAETPVGIALSQNNIDLISLNESRVSFDYSDNGIKAKTAWVGAKDALLVYDHNNNHVVDFAKELVLTQWSATAKTDFMALKEVFDSNKDNKFDARDAEFNKFLIWQDKNQDGISQAEELTPLGKAGLIAIDFDKEQTLHGEFFGKVQEMQVAETSWLDGHTTLAYDLAFGISYQ